MLTLVGTGQKPSAVGWEKNVQGKLGPRLADLAPMMDPVRYVPPTVSVCTSEPQFLPGSPTRPSTST